MKTKLMALEALKNLDAELRAAWVMRVLPSGVIGTKCITDAVAAIAALEAYIAKPVQPVSLSIITALRFYANGSHLHIDGDHHDFDTVSGEPDNLLFSGKDDDETMLEDGGIARQALRGKPILWIDGDDDETPKPIDGEVIHTTPQEPAAAGWMPIETAPKDGTPIDIWRSSNGGERCAEMRRVDLGSGNVFYEPVHSGYSCVRDMTHWMSLPAAPGGEA